MMKKLLCMAAILAFASLVYGADATFQDSGNHLWSDPANWDIGIPDPCDNARIVEDSTQGKFCLFNGGAYQANTLFLGQNAGVSGGVGENAKFEMTAGTLTLSGRIAMSIVKTSDYSVLDMSGGTIDAGGVIQLGYHPTKDNLREQVADIYLRGGTLEGLNIFIGTEGTVHMEEGAVLRLDNNQVDEINAYINDGSIVSAYGTRSLWNLDFGVTSPGYTTLTVTADLESAWQPNPEAGAEDVSYLTSLTWNTGDGIVSERLYFGTDFTAVQNGDVSVDMGLVSSPYIPATQLDLNTTYYWRIEGSDGVDTYAGNVWSFTTAPNIVIENFESYSSGTLKNTWKDGTDNNTGSSIVLETADINVAQGDQALKFSYANTAAGSTTYSEISREFAVSQNWEGFGIEALGVTLHGTPDANEAPFYLILEDEDGFSAQVNFQPASDLIQREWQEFIEWNIDLQVFRDAFVDTTAIKKIYLGSGDRGSVTGEATGAIFVDNISLYVPRYISDKFPEDIFPNGQVNRPDLTVFIQSWLDSEETITAQAPNPAGLWVHYTFDETSGFIANDSSGNSFNALINDIDNHYDPDGVFGGSIAFDGSFGVEPPVAIWDSSLEDEITISLWIKAPVGEYPVYSWLEAPFLFHGGSWNNTQYLVGFCPTPVLTDNNPDNRNATIVFRAAAEPGDANPSGNPSPAEDAYWDGVEPADWGDGQWVHLAFVKNANEEYNRIYRNGELVAENTDAGSLLNVQGLFDEGFYIGQLSVGGSNSYRGKMDDFRIYDYALSQSEVISLAQQSSVVQPIISGADFDGSGTVDLNDYYKLAGSWLDALVWP